MHFSRKSRPRQFNTTGDRIQRIDDINTFLHLAANKRGLCRCPLIMRLLFPLTTFRGSDVAVVFLHRTQYDVCFMFRVTVILNWLHRGQIFLFVNVHKLCLSENDISRLGA